MTTRLLSADQYYHEILEQIPKAKDRIVLAAMVLHYDSKTDEIFKVLNKALDNGVKVQLLTDTHSDVSKSKSMHAIKFKDLVSNTKENLIRLQEAGAEIWIVGQNRINTFKGCCHVKITIIDDEVYSFGGVNMNQSSFKDVDYMLNIKNKTIADYLQELVKQIGTESLLEDFEKEISENSSILFDSGHPRKSIIYDRACSLARKSKKVYCISQMVPSGRLSKHLRIIDSQIYFNHPHQTRSLLSLAIMCDKFLYRVNNLYQGDKRIHAKFILFELKNGEKALLSGSHNFSWRGVVYGTKEIALYSTSHKLWNDLYKFMKSAIVDATN